MTIDIIWVVIVVI